MAKQPRQQIQDLQGYGDTATPSATPVDTYTGKIGMPSQSSAQQLADAIGSVANQGAKIYAEQKAEELKNKQTLQEQRVKVYIEANKKKTVDDVAHLAPDVDLAVIGGLIEQDHYSSYYASTYNLLNNLSEAERLDPEKLLAAVNGLKVQAKTEVQGDFALAGTLKGIDTALQSVLTGNAGELQRSQVAKHEKSSYGMLFSIYSRSGDLSKPENLENFMQGLIDQDAIYLGDDVVKGTSPYGDRLKEKELLRKNIERLVKQYPEQGHQILTAFEQLPWEGDGTTEPFVYGLREQVTNLLVDKLEVKNARTQAEINEGTIKNNVEVHNMLLNGDLEGLEKIAFTPIDTNGMSDSQISLAMSKQQRAKEALSADIVPQPASDEVKNALITRLSTAAYTGDFTAFGFDKDERPNVIELQSAIYGRKDMNYSDRSILASNAEKLLKGYSSINLTKIRESVASKYSTQLNHWATFSNKLGGIEPLSELQDAYVNSFKSQLDSHYSNLEAVGEPSPTQLTEFHKQAMEDVSEVSAYINELTLLREDDGGQQRKQQIIDTLNDVPQVKIGDEMEDPETGEPIARVVGFDADNMPVYEPIEPLEETPSEPEDIKPEEDPRYEVTNKGETALIEREGDKAKSLQQAIKTYQKASEVLGFNEENATFSLPDDVLAKVEKVVKERYDIKDNRVGQGRSKRLGEPSAEDVKDMVIDALGLNGYRDFDYGSSLFGLVDDEADTAGEIAVKKLVDSLMEKYKGE